MITESSASGPGAPDEHCQLLIVIGVGGFGREVIDIVEGMAELGHPVQLVGSVDDADIDGSTMAELGVNLLGTTAYLASHGGYYAIGVGDGETRRAIANRLPSTCVPVALQHPAATVGGKSALAPGSILGSGARLATHVRVGLHANIHANATVGHDSVIGDYASLLPGALLSGNVTVGDGALIGAGAIILQGLTIGANAIVGAGAVVTTDVAAGTTVVGVPAHPLNK